MRPTLLATLMTVGLGLVAVGSVLDWGRFDPRLGSEGEYVRWARLEQSLGGHVEGPDRAVPSLRVNGWNGVVRRPLTGLAEGRSLSIPNAVVPLGLLTFAAVSFLRTFRGWRLSPAADVLLAIATLGPLTLFATTLDQGGGRFRLGFYLTLAGALLIFLVGNHLSREALATDDNAEPPREPIAPAHPAV